MPANSRESQYGGPSPTLTPTRHSTCVGGIIAAFAPNPAGAAGRQSKSAMTTNRGFALAALMAALAGLLGCQTGPAFPSPLSFACDPSASTANAVVEMFRSPFDGDFRVGNFFDHDLPLVFDDPAPRIVTLCGASLRSQVNGHNGYDFSMPEGTLLRAAGAGSVLVAGLEPPFYCPALNKDVQALRIGIQHTGPDGRVYVTVYGHLSRVDVSEGQSVQDGAPIGLSGNTGCSGSPHLHFGVFRQKPDGNFVVIDPYGWHGTTTDPWETNANGAKSAWLWRQGQAPALDR